MLIYQATKRVSQYVLKDEKEFERYGVDGMVFWANGADIAPEFLYENGTPVS